MVVASRSATVVGRLAAYAHDSSPAGYFAAIAVVQGCGLNGGCRPVCRHRAPVSRLPRVGRSTRCCRAEITSSSSSLKIAKLALPLSVFQIRCCAEFGSWNPCVWPALKAWSRTDIELVARALASASRSALQTPFSAAASPPTLPPVSLSAWPLHQAASSHAASRTPVACE